MTKTVEKVKATLFLSEDDRETVRQSGKTVEQFFADLMNLYRVLSMDKWSEGIFYRDHMRVCFVRAETLNYFVENSKVEDLRLVGKELAEQALVSSKIVFDWDLTAPENREKVIRMFNLRSGWGRVRLVNSSIVVENPLLSKPEFFMGYLEGLLGIDLELIEAYPDRNVFLIKNENEDTKSARYKSE